MRDSLIENTHNKRVIIEKIGESCGECEVDWKDFKSRLKRWELNNEIMACYKDSWLLSGDINYIKHCIEFMR